MKNTFVISGFGRSGTKWLSTLMNRSKIWTVEHEPSVAMDWCTVQKRFRKAFYGEVNSYLMPVLGRFYRLDRVGILLRDIDEIVSSCLAKGHSFNDLFIDHLNAWLSMMDQALEGGAHPISFRRMVTDIDYTSKLLKAFGIHDVAITPQDLQTKINASDSVPVHSSVVDHRCGWFVDKYRSHL